MKARAIVDANGTILGVIPLDITVESEDEDAPSGVDVVCFPDQTVQEIDIPDEIVKPPLHDLLQHFRVEKGKLIEIKAKKKGKKVR